ncbi:hypothetical protein ACH4VT_33510 [Streptomyces lydicus]|uniref:hypothetical protein n=1 Tax=Streptomyces lydicus TaxID=47763 RepID=UPI00378A5F7E
MTRDKKRKTAVRAAQLATGHRYIRAARELATTAQAHRMFLLKELLAECATMPPADVDWEDLEGYGPSVFESALLRAAVPFGTVLELAGALAREGTDAQLRLESLTPLESATIIAGERRFELILNQELVYELCRQLGCPHQPVNPIIIRCREHLADCDEKELAAMAGEWGVALHEELGRDAPHRLGGSPEADLLIEAAVARGAFETVSTSFLHACFEDPELIEEIFWDEDEALDMRHALERERIRLQRVAREEAHRASKKAGFCVVCGTQLVGAGLHIPPQYCSRDCVPPPTSAPISREEPPF